MEPVQWNYNSPLANGLPIPVLRNVLEDVFVEEHLIMQIGVLDPVRRIFDLDPVRRTLDFNHPDIVNDDPDIVNDVPPRQNSIRLIPTELNELQIQTFIANNELCPICLTEYFMVNEGKVFKSGEVLKNGCSHYCHVECLKNWLKVRNACPMCRAEIRS
jgi:hypothetical protein